MQDYEKLGAFYLGKIYNGELGVTRDEILLYDAKDLTTHAVCVGMTGSGKTGLCLALLEEAAIDGIPAIAIDPKGDLGNLLLTFPGLSATDFKPWIDPGAAVRKGQTVEQYAANVAETWRNGLAAWGQKPERIERLRAAADFAIYTPGGSAGLPISVLKSFDAPAEATRADADSLRDRIQSAVSGLLGMLGIQADPVQSREHILLANLLHHSWSRGEGTDLAGMIHGIQEPPFDRLGVLDLESFYPAGDRFALAMRLNNLLASPGFDVWMKGEVLEIQRLLWTPEGRPRVSILSIAHLGEAERMFFVTLLLNELIAWMRSQPGTSSLRALFYMDEIFGYFPPTANPPSKTTMLALLKQARAYGLGCVLATQNPVDLDYKGLSNAGTWFIGRLQTERDKARVMDGLEGAAGSAGSAFDRVSVEKTISGLGSRVFLMNNVHEDAPVLFQTRWAMSYLRGPLTRPQIEQLTGDRKSPAPSPEPPAAVPDAVAATAIADAPDEVTPPVLPPGITQVYLPADKPLPTGYRLLYRPAIGAVVKLHFVNASAGVDSWQTISLLGDLPGSDRPVDWNSALRDDGEMRFFEAPAMSTAVFGELPSAAARKANHARWEKELKAWLYQEIKATVWKCAELKEFSGPGESQGAFRVRLQQLVRERRDLEKEKLRVAYTPKLARIQERIRKASERIEKEKTQFKHQALNTALSVGATLLGALFGRSVGSVGNVTRAGTAVRRGSQAARERGDIARAESDLKSLDEQLAALEKEFEVAAAGLAERFNAEQLSLDSIDISPRKSDISIRLMGVAWTPWHVNPEGIAVKASS